MIFGFSPMVVALELVLVAMKSVATKKTGPSTKSVLFDKNFMVMRWVYWVMQVENVNEK